MRALLGRGTHVVVPSRSRRRLDALAHGLPEAHRALLHAVRADVSDPDEATEVREALLARHGRLDGVVASLGTYERGTPIADTDVRTWSRLLHDNLTPHFVVARTFAPVLGAGAAYVTLAGVAAREPMRKAAAISVTGAGQTMLLRVLAEELSGTGARFHEVSVLTPIAGHWFDHPPQPGWLTGEEVGGYVADVLEPGCPDSGRMMLSLPEPGSPRVWWRRDVDAQPAPGPLVQVGRDVD